MVVSMVLPTNAIAKTVKKTAKAATTTTYQTKIEFEKANRFEQNGRNRIDKFMFPGIPGTDMFIWKPDKPSKDSFWFLIWILIDNEK